jgi:NAD(P)-dependent dehydrogenase (short-subunit alcohol dehydrogenase family)
MERKKLNAKDYVSDIFNLEGHVGIVTGASRGIGFGTAKVLTDAGARVYNLDVSPRGNDDILEGDMIDIQVNLFDRAACKKIIDDIAKKEGHIDFLINNAGMTYKARAEEFPMDKYANILNLNLETVFEMSRMCYPYLKKSEFIGRIVSISSMGAHMGFVGIVPYNMTKSGILGLTTGLAEEWKNDNILVNSVAPGWFLTKLNEGMFKENPDRKAAALNKVTLGRFGFPVEIGYMMLFLLSKASTYLTGQDFAVDGGALTHGY